MKARAIISPARPRATAEVIVQPLFQATRYHLPLPPGRLTPRPRLFARLGEALAHERGPALVQAPPGFGKSTLVGAWLATRPTPWAWLSLDADDNDIERLTRHLVVALDGVAPAAGARLLPRLATRATRGGRALRELLAILHELPGPVTVAIDNLHLVHEAEALAALSVLAAGDAHGLRIVFCTTAPPDSRLALRRPALTLGANDLRMTVDEAADLISWGVGLRLEQPRVAELVRLTFGCPAALQLTALALLDHPEPVRLMAELAQSGQAAPGEDLAARLATTLGAEAAGFYERACLWHEEAGLIDEAADYAFATGSMVFTAKLIERQGMALIERGEGPRLDAWCRRIPEAIFTERPRLCLIHAWAAALAPRDEGRDLAEARLSTAERGLATADAPTRAWVGGQRANLRGHLLLYASQPDFEALIAHSRQALTMLPEDEVAIRSVSAQRIAYGYMGLSDAEGALRALDVAQRLAIRGRNYYGAIACVFDRARIAHVRGRLREAAQECRLWKEAFPRLAHDVGPVFPAGGCLDVALGCVLLEQGDLAGAAACLGRGLELTGTVAQFALVGYPALARLRAALGDLAGVATALGYLEQRWPEAVPYTHGLLCLYRLRASPADPAARAAAQAWANTHTPLVGAHVLLPGIGKTMTDEPRYETALIWAHLQTTLDRPREALAALEPLAIGARNHGLIHRVIELSVAQSRALNALGDRPRALASLARAQALAAPEGYRLVFTQEPDLAPLLGGLANPDAALPLSAPSIPPARTPPPAPPQTAHALSPREIDVLRMLAASANNEQIAARLGLSTNTVKTHLRHIFAKLGVSKRSDALARCHALGLLGQAPQDAS